MQNIKQYLKDKTLEEIKETEQQINKSDEEIRILEAKFKIEKKFSGMRDIPEEIKDDVKYSAEALENMLAMEKNRNTELKKEFEVLRYRKQVIDKFEDGEL